MEGPRQVVAAGLAAVLAAVLAGVLAAGCGSVADSEDAEVAKSEDRQSTPTPLSQAGFGGVLEVVFETDDAAVQDEIAAGCGLSTAQPEVAQGAGLQPTVRWYTKPDPEELEAIRTCLAQQDLVRRTVLPL